MCVASSGHPTHQSIMLEWTELLLYHYCFFRVKPFKEIYNLRPTFDQVHGRDNNGSANAGGITSVSSIEADMQELAKLVLTSSPSDLDADVEQTFLTVARSFYYTAHCNPGTVNFHMAKVLFERVL